jgi:HAD superfamily hydrolase (TIGR01509 family)
MDGVLCDSEPFLFEAASQMFLERHSLKVRRSDFAPFVGTGEDRYIGGVAEKYGIELEMPADKLRTYEIYLDVIRERLHPLPGASEFIKRVRAAGLKRAVATSADRVKMEGNLREIGIPPTWFDICVTGSEVVHKKPHPQIFLTAAEKLALEPSACLIVEDSISGVTAAKAAGATCLGLMTSFKAQELRDTGADWLAPDLAHVPDEVVSLLVR